MITKKINIKLVAIIFLMIFFSMAGLSKSAKASPSGWSYISVVRHAGGGIDDVAYTNSAEALEGSILSGCGAVEMDFMFTSDGTLVCVHDWDDIGLKKQPKLKQFRKLKIYGKYTTMTAEEALTRMVAAKCFLIIDTKEKDTVSVYKEIDRLLTQIEGGEAFKKKLVPQIYAHEEYDLLSTVYPYKNWIFTTYKLKYKKNSEFKELAAFCKEKGIKTVTIPKERVTEKRVEYFTKKKIRVATHTVNGAEEWERMTDMGVSIIYTDFGK
ncbi:MAG: hypothetical protein J6Y89_02255 [Lachnospiraceae bacterium]|nr:hypothetical protein [Lachnospiraceae bacterium]